MRGEEAKREEEIRIRGTKGKKTRIERKRNKKRTRRRDKRKERGMKR